MSHENRGRRGELEHEVPVAHRIDRVVAQAVELEKPGRDPGVEGKAGPRQGRRPEGEAVDPAPRVRETRGVPLEHRVPGEHVVAEGDRLGRLKVGEARHHRVRLAFGEVEDCAPKPAQRVDDGVRLAPGVEAKIGGHLVVARPAGMELLARFADPLGERGLDVHVDVLERRGPLEAAGFDIRLDPAEAGHDGIPLVRLDDPDLGEHGGVRYGPRDVLPVEPPVEIDRCRERFHRGIGRLGEPARPQLRHRRCSPRAVLRQYSEAPRANRRFAEPPGHRSRARAPLHRRFSFSPGKPST